MLELLDRKEKPDGEGDVDAILDDLGLHKPPRIRCPLCDWEPQKHDRWMCRCEHVWNTFDTRGVCPQCSYRWLVTQCLRCHRFSAHEDWYEKPGRDR